MRRMKSAMAESTRRLSKEAFQSAWCLEQKSGPSERRLQPATRQRESAAAGIQKASLTKMVKFPPASSRKTSWDCEEPAESEWLIAVRPAEAARSPVVFPLNVPRRRLAEFLAIAVPTPSEEAAAPATLRDAASPGFPSSKS